MNELWLRKLAGAAVMPLSLVMLMLALGTLLLWANRTRAAGRWIVTATLVVLACLSYGFPFDRFARELETRYPSLARPESAGARWIVVLGAGVRSDEAFPLSSRLMDDSLYRLVEAVRLHRAIEGSRIIVCGGAVLNAVPSAYVVRDLARALGVSEHAIVVEDRPRDTSEEAKYVRERVGDTPVIVVTSALHMPRAMLAFEAQGVRAIAAPTQHRIATGPGSLHPGNFFPSIERLAVAQGTAYEMLGMAWQGFRGSGRRGEMLESRH